MSKAYLLEQNSYTVRHGHSRFTHCFFPLAHWQPWVGFATLRSFLAASLFLHICLQAHSLLQPSLIRRQSQRSDLVHAFFAGFAGSTSHEHLQMAWFRQSPRYLNFFVSIYFASFLCVYPIFYPNAYTDPQFNCEVALLFLEALLILHYSWLN